MWLSVFTLGGLCLKQRNKILALEQCIYVIYNSKLLGLECMCHRLRFMTVGLFYSEAEN